MPNYQDNSKKRNKKGKGLGTISNPELKELLKKQGFLATMSEDQQKSALDYEGEDTLGFLHDSDSKDR